MLFQKLLQPLAHTMQVPGKQIVPRIAHAYNYWLKVPADKLTVLKEIEPTFHYSLIL
jgi:geranylgeranyl diphosphate synthase type 3